MNWQNSKCKFVYKFAQSISKRITCILKFHNRKRLVKEESRPSPLQRRNFFLSSFRRFQNQNWNGAHHTAYVELCLHFSRFRFFGEHVFSQVLFLTVSSLSRSYTHVFIFFLLFCHFSVYKLRLEIFSIS